MPCIIPKSTLSSRLQLLDLAARPSGLVRIAADAKARTVHLTARGTTAVLHFAVPTGEGYSHPHLGHFTHN